MIDPWEQHDQEPQGIHDDAAVQVLAQAMFPDVNYAFAPAPDNALRISLSKPATLPLVRTMQDHVLGTVGERLAATDPQGGRWVVLRETDADDRVTALLVGPYTTAAEPEPDDTVDDSAADDLEDAWLQRQDGPAGWTGGDDL